MPHIYNVKEGAILSCSQGSTTSCFKVPVSHGVCIQGKNEATIMDNKVGINIMPFGICTKYTSTLPCEPVIILPWLLGKKDFKLKEELALLNYCILPCLCGGIIKINEDGQSK